MILAVMITSHDDGAGDDDDDGDDDDVDDDLDGCGDARVGDDDNW